jgi:hypothetical protein
MRSLLTKLLTFSPTSFAYSCLKKTCARSSVFESYTAQYEILEAQKAKPSDFEQQLADLPESLLIEGYLILEPRTRN